jgi:prepilin-type N-terminal cleavage/methylation domain-containing protein
MTPRKRILVLDSGSGVALLCRRLLERTGGYLVGTGEFGEHTVESALGFAPDLILLDFDLPTDTTRDVVAKLRASEKLAHVTIALVTGDPEGESRDLPSLRDRFSAAQLHSFASGLLSAHRSPAASLQSAFTLIEIMIVVTILALLAMIATPNILRARKRGQATAVLNDLRMLGDSLDRWALDNGKSPSAAATIEDLKPYLKKGSPLYETGCDALGNEFGPKFVVDEGPKLPDATWQALADVAPAEFWSPYR